MKKHFCKVLPVLLGVFLWPHCMARGEMLFREYLRELAISSHTIVVARPVKGRSLPKTGSPDHHSHKSSFVVEEVLKGDRNLATQELEVSDGGMFVLSSPFSEKDIIEIKSAMLCLHPRENQSWNLNHLYVCTPEDMVMRPMQWSNPGPYVLNENLQISWAEAKGMVRRFLPQVETLRALRTIPDAAERNRQLFSWITEHEDEFGRGPFPGAPGRHWEPETGWGSLEHEVFQWILEGGITVDSWLAMQRHADLRRSKEHDWSLSQNPSQFSHTEGRAFLLEKLVDEKQLLIARRTAAIELAKAINPGRGTNAKNAHLTVVTPQEQEGIIRAALPLAGHDDTHLRQAVLDLLLSASAPFREHGFPQLNKMAFPAITTALLKERKHELLSDLPASLHHLMDESEWQAVTGNAGRICVTLSPQPGDGALRLWADPEYLPEGVTLPVELILERLDEQNKVQETLTRKVGLVDAKKWDADWHGSVMIEDLPTENLAVGLWKAHLKGVSADARKLPWTSWHTCFRVR